MVGYRRLRQIRKITNEMFGITIPDNIAITYSKTSFIVIPDGENIILQSGARI